MPKKVTITCPYNPSHQICQERIQYHLVKCRKNHPTADHVICPYNASHHIPKSEEQYHIADCPDRKLVELSKYRFNYPAPGNHGNIQNPVVYGSSSIVQPHAFEDDEDERPRFTLPPKRPSIPDDDDELSIVNQSFNSIATSLNRRVSSKSPEANRSYQHIRRLASKSPETRNYHIRRISKSPETRSYQNIRRVPSKSPESGRNYQNIRRVPSKSPESSRNYQNIRRVSKSPETSRYQNIRRTADRPSSPILPIRRRRSPSPLISGSHRTPSPILAHQHEKTLDISNVSLFSVSENSAFRKVPPTQQNSTINNSNIITSGRGRSALIRSLRRPTGLHNSTILNETTSSFSEMSLSTNVNRKGLPPSRSNWADPRK